MNLFDAILLGGIEGLTEFVPVSSTFHLIFSGRLLGLASSEFLKLFEVFIQSGAILAIVFLYFAKLKQNHVLLRNVAISFIPTAIIGFLLYSLIKNVFFEGNLLLLSASFIVGAIFIFAELLIKRGHLKPQKTLIELTVWQAFAIGIFQALAVVPGVSRSGATILAMLLLGFKRPEAAVYSFLLAIPTIISASALDLIRTPVYVLTLEHLGLLAVGFIVSFILAHFSAHWLINFLKKHTLIPFGIYRIILSIIFFLIFK